MSEDCHDSGVPEYSDNISIPCPGCGRDVLPEEALPIDVQNYTPNGYETVTLVFHKDVARSCPFVYSMRKLEESRIRMAETLRMFEEAKGNNEQV